MATVLGILVDDSLLVIVALASFVAIIGSLIVLFILIKQKRLEKRHASLIVKKVELLKQGRQLAASGLAIKKEETSLKELLIKKFKPLVEQQLSSQVEVLDFNAKGENFLMLVQLADAKLLLKLDASGKILDYERAKKKTP